jgi:uncharacterized protein
MHQASRATSMNWVLDDLVRRVDGVSQAVLLSRDGLTLGGSEGISRDDAEHLAAVAAGIQSLARSAASRFDGGQTRQSIIHMDRLLFFVMSAAQGSCLAVLCRPDADHGVVAYEMATLVNRLGQYLSANPRAAVLPDAAERLAE